MNAMSIEEQIKKMAREEIRGQLSEIEAGLRAYLEKEIGEIKERQADLLARTEALESRLDERMSLLMKIRKHTLDQLMSEYKRLTGSMRPEQEEPAENAEI